MRSWLIPVVAIVFVTAGLTVAVPVQAQTFSSTVWQLVEVPGEVKVTPSSRFTVQFRSDGTVVVRADCIRASGLWSGDLNITITQATLERCSDGEEFLLALDEANEYTLKGRTLLLHRESSEDIVLAAAPA